jgi:hypothetical protein
MPRAIDFLSYILIYHIDSLAIELTPNTSSFDRAIDTAAITPLSRTDSTRLQAS